MWKMYPGESGEAFLHDKGTTFFFARWCRRVHATWAEIIVEDYDIQYKVLGDAVDCSLFFPVCVVVGHVQRLAVTNTRKTVRTSFS